MQNGRRFTSTLTSSQFQHGSSCVQPQEVIEKSHRSYYLIVYHLNQIYFHTYPSHDLLKKNILFTELLCARQRISAHVLSDRHMVYVTQLVYNLLVISCQQSVSSAGAVSGSTHSARCQSFTGIIIHTLVLDIGWGTKYICLPQYMLVCVMNFVQLLGLKKLRTDCPIPRCVRQNTEQMALYQVGSAFTKSSGGQSCGNKDLKLTPQLGNKANGPMFGQES